MYREWPFFRGLLSNTQMALFKADMGVAGEYAKLCADSDVGQRVFESVSREAWQQWLAHQTMLINENRLKVFAPEARKFLEGELEKYFFGEGAETPAGYVAPDKS